MLQKIKVEVSFFDKVDLILILRPVCYKNLKASSTLNSYRTIIFGKCQSKYGISDPYIWNRCGGDCGGDNVMEMMWWRWCGECGGDGVGIVVEICGGDCGGDDVVEIVADIMWWRWCDGDCGGDDVVEEVVMMWWRLTFQNWVCSVGILPGGFLLSSGGIWRYDRARSARSSKIHLYDNWGTISGRGVTGHP